MTDLTSDLIGRNFETHNGELLLGGIAIGDIVQQHGTPLFIYDQRVLDRTWHAFRAALPDAFHVHYSMKANPHQAFLRYFVDCGCGLEVASAGEIHQAMQAGCPASDIIFAGPGKSDDELAMAVNRDIGEVHVESIAEAKRLHEIAGDSTVRVALRINAASEAQGGAMRMGGKPSPFGIDEECLDDAVREIQRLPSLRIVGVHLFTGTQILDHEVLLAQYRTAVGLARRVANQIDAALETIDFGGGWGIPYFAHESRLELDALSLGLVSLAKEIARDRRLSAARLIVEPGRFLVGEAGVYVARVLEVKESRGKRFIIADGGMHHHLAASGNLGQTIKRNYPIAIANRLDEEIDAKADVVGPLCTPLDVLGRSVALPSVEAGDLVVVFQSGAYARTASPHGFLSHPSPAEVWIERGSDRLIRERGQLSDPLRDQIPFQEAASQR